MGLFDVFKGRPPPRAAPLDPAAGWAAIHGAFAQLYPDQKPRHWSHGGIMRMHDLRVPPENPLDGVSIYDAGSFWHYVSFGLSDLYAEEPREEWSGFGYELTFRLASSHESDPPLWPINVMGSLARAAFSGSRFGPGHSVKLGPLDGPQSTTPLVAVLLTHDPGLEPVYETPHGKLSYFLLVGVDASTRERALALGGAHVLAELRARNPAFVTRL